MSENGEGLDVPVVTEKVGAEQVARGGGHNAPMTSPEKPLDLPGYIPENPDGFKGNPPGSADRVYKPKGNPSNPSSSSPTTSGGK